MHKLVLLLMPILFISCKYNSNNSPVASLANKLSDTSRPNKSSDSISQMDKTDSGGDTPSQMDERERIASNYNAIDRIDTTLLNGNDSLHIHLKYYCLKDTTLIVPKSYEDNSLDFATHPYVSDLLVINGNDTVLNRQFKASDFSAYYHDNFGGNLKKYGSILAPTFSRKSKNGNRIVLHYSIAIPTTEIGIGVYLIVSPQGGYRVVDNFEQI